MNNQTQETKWKQMPKLLMYNLQKVKPLVKTANTSSHKIVKLQKHLSIDLQGSQLKKTLYAENKN